MRSPHRLLAQAILGVVTAFVALGAAGSPSGATRLLRATTGITGCGLHSTYASACAVERDTFEDSLMISAPVNFYRLEVAPAGQAVRVRLDRSLGLQAALIRDASGMTGPVRGGLTSARPAYLVDEFGPPIPNESISGGAPQTTIGPYAAPFQAAPFESIPFESIPFESIPFEQTAGEQPGFRPIQLVGLTDGSTDQQTLTHFSDALDGADLQPAALILAVWATATAPRTYSVTIDVQVPHDLCNPGLGVLPPVPDGFTPLGDAVPAIPEGVATLILTSETRWARLYGVAGAAAVMEQLSQLAASPLVNGLLVSIDADPRVAAAYAAWDGDLCSATRANAVAAAIKRRAQRWLATYPSIQYVVLAGDDAIVPHFRVPDDARIANEGQYANQTGLSTNGADEASFLRRNLLTDDYYTDAHGTLSGSRVLYTAQRATGRLVESPADVTATVQAFLRQDGVLNAASGLVTGYGFLRGAADAMAQVFTGHLAPLTRLNGDAWSAADVNAALAGDAAGPDVVFISGHFAHGAMQTASLDAYPATSLLGQANLAGKLLFTTGCHGGASIVDAEADPTTGFSTFDWAQAVTTLGGALVANTGYAYGDSDVSAYSEELMLAFADVLVAGDGQPVAVGDALRAAKQLYRSRNDGKWDGYHSKTLMEATLFGLPMYRVAIPGSTPMPPAIPDLPATPASTAMRYLGAQQRGLFAYHAEIAVPPLIRHEAPSGHGAYFTSPEGLDIRAFQPVQPQLTFRLPQVPGFTAHGVVVSGASYAELAGFDPLIMRPLWDQAEYEPQFHYEAALPAGIALINTVPDPDGTAHQNLILTAGQFRGTDDVPAGDPNDPSNPYVADGIAYPHTVGREWLYQHVSLDVYYSADDDWRGARPVQATLHCVAPGTASIDVAIAGSTAISVTATIATDGQLTAAPLSGAGATWTGTMALGAGANGATVSAVDAAGNVALLAVQPGAEVAAGCPGTRVPPTPAPLAPGSGEAGAASARITILDIQPPVAAGSSAPVAISIRGTWDAGALPCRTSGAPWTIVVTATGSTGGEAPTVTLPAPCGPEGRPAVWQTLVTLPAMEGTVQVCAVLVTTSPSSRGADVRDCRTVSIPAPTLPEDLRSPASHAPPVTTANLSPPPDAQGNYPDPVTLTFSATAAAGWSIAQTSVALDGGPAYPYTLPIVVRGVGSHSVVYYSVDSAGIAEVPKSLAFTVVARRDVSVTLSGPGSVDEGDTKSYQVAISPPREGGGVHVFATCGAAGVLVESPSYEPAMGAGSFQCFFPDGPAHTEVRVQVLDDAGLPGTFATVQVAIANLSPVVTVTEPPANTVLPAGSITVAGHFVDPGIRDTHTCAVIWLVAGGEQSTGGQVSAVTPGIVHERAGQGTCVATSSLTPGAYTARVRVTDQDGGVGMASRSFSVHGTPEYAGEDAYLCGESDREICVMRTHTAVETR